MQKQPRSIAVRVTLMMVLVISAAGLSAVVGLKNEWLAGALVVALYGFLATRVSLPWYYVGWFAVPIVGMIAFWRISWRVACLPWRDWDLRPGEKASSYDLVPSPIVKRRDDIVVVRPD